MTKINKIYLSISVAVISITILYFCSLKSVELILLTWDAPDTSHNITINYISENLSQNATVYYDTVSREGVLSNYSYKKQGKVRTHPNIDFNVYSTRLDNLDPEESYYFVVGDENTGYSKERKFKTIPTNGDIRFISGGDAGVTQAFSDISEIAAQSNPHFAILGGDIAYANGDVKKQNLWLELLDIWQRTMVTPDGHTVPVIAVVGNHEVNTKEQPGKKSLNEAAPFFDLIFQPADQKTYFKRQIGKNGILFILDTDHVFSSGGEQLDWMHENFKQHRNSPFRFSSYHVPLYPSYYKPDSPQYERLRKNWLPLFDETHLQVAFENHEHTLKKSMPLYNNQPAEKQGTIYIGDGDWGTKPRQPVSRWYIEKSRAINHVWAVTFNKEKATFKALTLNGIDDSFTFNINSSVN